MSSPSAEFERGDSPPLPSVPPILVEPDVPNPFSLDDSDSEEVSPVHDLERSLHLATFDSVHSSASATSHVVPLEAVSPPQVSQSLISLNLNKDVPPPPSESESNESEDIPDIIEPGLIASAMFLPIPNVCRIPLRSCSCTSYCDAPVLTTITADRQTR
jgi:trafficking protein particle complex subunit 12